MGMEQFITVVASWGNLLFFGMVFVSVVLMTFAIARMTANWSELRKRTVAARAVVGSGAGGGTARLAADERAMGPLAGLTPTDEEKKTELLRFLNGAGYYGPNAVIIFQLTRILLAVGLGLATALLDGRLFPKHPFLLTMALSIGMTLLGYMLPRSIVSLRRDRLVEEHRIGFPDFLDLMVICVEAGIGIDSAVDRVVKDMQRSFPSLARNLGFMSLELRAGRSTREALDNLGQRLGIEEARSFATLVRQSEELGTSLVQSLRVYSMEMRQKRLMRAEEKAASLPVKLVLPLALFIFPVILGITLMPVAMKLFQALKIH
jgi:tight adherence protein C